MNESGKNLNLPWQVNGTLERETPGVSGETPDENPQQVREREYLKGLRITMQESSETTPGELGLARLKRSLREHSVPRRAVRWWRAAAIAASLLVAVEAGFLIRRHPPVGYEPLGRVTQTGDVLQITFAAGARADAVERLLRQVGAQIIDGPSAAGVYRIRVTDRADLDRRIVELRSHRDIIEEVNRE